MKLTVISDLHGSVTHVDALRRACAESDALVVCGDFTTFGILKAAKKAMLTPHAGV